MTDAPTPTAERCRVQPQCVAAAAYRRRERRRPPSQPWGQSPEGGEGGPGGGGLSPGAALGTVPEVWGLSLGMEDFHAAWPSDLL